MQTTSPTSEIYEKALQLQDLLLESMPSVSFDTWVVSRATAHLLKTWNLTNAAIVACLLAPIIELQAIGKDWLIEAFGSESVDLAFQFLHLRLFVNTSVRSNELNYSFIYRSILRQINLDLPNLELTIIFIADQYVRVMRTTTPDPQVATITWYIYNPVIEVLGLWKLRRDWIEKILAEVFTSDYREMEQELSLAGYITNPPQRSLTESTEEQNNTAHHNGTTNDADDAWLRVAKIDIRAELDRAFERNGLTPQPSFQLIDLTPGATLARAERKEQRRQFANRMLVKVLCESSQDCYHALGAIHQMGHPVSGRLVVRERLYDYIASPQPDGYQALHTAINFRGSRSKEILVEFRIMTHAMGELNDWGAVASLYLAPQKHLDTTAWWIRQMPIFEPDRNRDQRITKTKFIELLTQNEIGSSSALIYVFTPRGETVVLREGSTPLDFAYYIHTELGHKSVGFDVNGIPALFGYTLQNGDLVKVQYSLDSVGPDLSWLIIARSPEALSKIRKKLNERAQSIHEGRAKLELLLIDRILHYRSRHFTLSITNGEFDAFIILFVKKAGFTDPQSLYDSIASKNYSPNKIIHNFVSRRLAPAVVDSFHKRLPYITDRISFCAVCEPIPGDLIFGASARVGISKKITIHRQSHPGCLASKLAKNVMDLQWTDVIETDIQEYARLEVLAIDRPQLLRDILDKVYEEKVVVHEVLAKTHNDYTADIELVVSSPDIAKLPLLSRQIAQTVSNVKNVYLREGPDPRLIRSNSVGNASFLQPYNINEVFHRDTFYDRQEQIQAITDWLKSGSNPCLILHGQGRVGKSSLAQYLTYQIFPLQQLAYPIFLDAHDLSYFDTQHILHYIVSSVASALKISTPEIGQWDEVVPWAKSCLKDASLRIGNNRLVIIIDEFSSLMDINAAGKLDDSFFGGLLSIIFGVSNVFWLLIMHDDHFEDSSRWKAASPIVQRSESVHVQHLDQNWSRKLIVEPANKHGISYENEVIEQIILLTDGNPYLINVLCSFMLNRFDRAAKKKTFNLQDLAHATKMLLSDGSRSFIHLTKNTLLVDKMVLAFIAENCRVGKSLSLTAIATGLSKQVPQLREIALQNALVVLQARGAISLRDRDTQEYCIPIQIFHKWAIANLSLETLKSEWMIKAISK